MPAINLKEMRINKNCIEIHSPKGAQIKLNISFKTKLDTPKDRSNKTVIFHVITEAKSEEGTVSILVEADFIFELDELPNEYNNEFSENCARISIQKVSDAIDNTLEIMGYKKINIAGNTQI